VQLAAGFALGAGVVFLVRGVLLRR
jgi:hypothetical protein